MAAVWNRDHYFVYARGQRRLDDVQWARDNMPDYHENAPVPTSGSGPVPDPRPTLLLYEGQEPRQLSTSVRQSTSAALAIDGEARHRALALADAFAAEYEEAAARRQGAEERRLRVGRK